ncbi:hypothetical protein TWF192_005204 [Orbilia oligospora]|uniref:Uncharacterized protein n=1 Tax=Orbilia oligospora TaxID=2813651 RepID=A0A6G1M9F1_ORBOL|nr:hypothetical protein TWF191_004551 [Orbilia oligospora]KAF3250765.1 hypothetical protein TWF192_005204 [Orbilia oligospora]
MIEALPPPYLSSKETTSSPYDPTSTSPFPSEEPTYEYSVSRRYSSRLRRLLLQRSSSRGVYLTLHIPHTLNNCKLISIESASSTSSSSSSSSTSSCDSSGSEDNASISTADTDYEGMNENLIHYQSTNTNYEKQPLLTSPSSLPFIEDLEAGTLVIKPSRSSLKSHNGHRVLGGKSKKSKRVKFKKDPKYRHRDRLAYGYIGDEEKETSWLTFFLLLLLVFTMVCGAGVFIAWALGFAGGKTVAAAAGGLHTGIIAAAAAGPGAIPVKAAPVVAAGSAPVVQEVNGVPKKEGVTKRKLEKRLLDGVRDRLRLRLGGVAIAPEKRDASPEEVEAAPVGRHYYKRKPVHEEGHEGGEDASSNKRKHKRSMGHEEYVQSADMVF